MYTAINAKGKFEFEARNDDHAIVRTLATLRKLAPLGATVTLWHEAVKVALVSTYSDPRPDIRRTADYHGVNA